MKARDLVPVIAKSDRWEVTLRKSDRNDVNEERYYVRVDGEDTNYLFKSEEKAILHAIERVYRTKPEGQGKNLMHFEDWAYAMLTGMEVYK